MMDVVQSLIWHDMTFDIFLARVLFCWTTFQVSKTLSPSQIKAVYEKFDVNGDGKLSRKEFRKLMERE